MLNVVNGDKVAVDAILEHPDIAAVSFVGSTPIAKYIQLKGIEHGKRVQALGGAKNHMLVLPDADLDLAADPAINAAYGSAGERCMAVSVVVAVGDTGDELIGKIAERADKGLRIGPGDDPASEMGPLITREHRDKVASYVEGAAAQGADVVIDGTGYTVEGHEDGYLIGVSLLDKVTSRDGRLPGRDLRPGAVRRPRRDVRRGHRADEQLAAGATAPRSSPGTAVRPAASSWRSRPAWSA